MSKNLKQDCIEWNKLPHRDLLKQEIIFKSINVVSPLNLLGDLEGKRLNLTDEGLVLLPAETEKDIINALQVHLKKSDLLPTRPYFLLNHFSSPRVQTGAFELDERASVFCLAVNLITKGSCFFLGAFHYNDKNKPKTYFSPFITKEEYSVGGFEEREIPKLSSQAEFESLNEIYIRLRDLKIFKYDERFSRLINSIRFYSRIQNEPWFMQKIIFAFIALESLFTDKSKIETVYKVSVRASYFLFPDNAMERKQVYNLLKIAYDARSCFLHGTKVDEARLAKKLQKLKENEKYSLWFDLPFDLNEIISQIILKIIKDKKTLGFFSERQDDAIEEVFFTHLVLGTNNF